MRHEHADGHDLIPHRLGQALGAGCLALGLGILPPDPAAAGELPPPPLAQILPAAAAWAGVDPALLAAVVWVESRGWPWALNVRGQPLFPRSRAEAIQYLRRHGAHGTDIGVAQIHYPVWGPALGLTPEQLLDPWTNLHAAALILRRAMAEEAGWGGVGRYHSATLSRKWPYARAVAATWRALTAPPAAPR